MNNLKIKHHWLSWLSKPGKKTNSVGAERDNRMQEQSQTLQNELNEPSCPETSKSDADGADLMHKNQLPIRPTLTKPCEDPSPVEGQRSVNELAYDSDVRKLI